MEKYNKFLRNITELIEKGLFTSKNIKKEVEDFIKNRKYCEQIKSCFKRRV